MFYLSSTNMHSVDLAHYRLSRTKDCAYLRVVLQSGINSLSCKDDVLLR